MADFQVLVENVGSVSDHPNADRLSLVTIGGYTAISAKLDDGSHRYAPGDAVVYIPEGAVVPEWMLRKMGFWDEGKGRGSLSGSAGNRVKAIRLRGVFSQGLLYPATRLGIQPPAQTIEIEGETCGGLAFEGDNVADFLGITKFEPKVPQSMAGVQGALFGVTLKYDFESIQRQTKLFEPGEMVAVTEKVHGTNIQIGYVPGAYPEGEDFYVTSKGLGAKGFNLKDDPANDGNLYVRKLREFGTLDIMKLTSESRGGAPVRIYGEVFGPGVQDLTYGMQEPILLVFDIQVGDRFLPPEEMAFHAQDMMLDTVPTLYVGPYDLAVIEKHRDGKTTLGGDHVREGVVIKSMAGNDHPRFGRKIGKWVSPDYLLRKNATEFA